LGPVIFTGVLLGIGIVGFIDESIFHQLLQWHNFYWATDQRGRILSDGLFHVGSTLLLLWGALRLWRDRASWTAAHSRAIVAGILIGAGGFNTYDGVVQHVILHFHLVNEHVCKVANDPNNSIMNCQADIPYEVVWILVGAIILGSGVVLARRAPHEGAVTPHGRGA
jgi:uncharacterized membrane protein